MPRLFSVRHSISEPDGDAVSFTYPIPRQHGSSSQRRSHSKNLQRSVVNITEEGFHSYSMRVTFSLSLSTGEFIWLEFTGRGTQNLFFPSLQTSKFCFFFLFWPMTLKILLPFSDGFGRQIYSTAHRVGHHLLKGNTSVEALHASCQVNCKQMRHSRH